MLTCRFPGNHCLLSQKLKWICPFQLTNIQLHLKQIHKCLTCWWVIMYKTMPICLSISLEMACHLHQHFTVDITECCRENRTIKFYWCILINHRHHIPCSWQKLSLLLQHMSTRWLSGWPAHTLRRSTRFMSSCMCSTLTTDGTDLKHCTIEH